MNFTPEQLSAIEEKGSNIIVSAGAGSGKTAVLTERIFRHVYKDNWEIDRMLVLTFTNAAAAEMKKRIRDKINQNENNVLSDEERRKQLNKIDSSYIMTFDAYALSLVRKYHYIFNIDKDVNVIDGSILGIKKEEILEEIFNEKYSGSDNNFKQLIKQFCVKDDDEIKNTIKKIDEKLSLIYNREKYIDDYEENFFSEKAINENIKDYEEFVLEEVKKLNSLVNDFSEYVDYQTIYPNINILLNASSYDDVRQNVGLVDTSKQLRGALEEAKKIKSNIKKEIDRIEELTTFSKEEIKQQLLSTKDNSLVLLKLAEELYERTFEYKKANSLYEFADIFKMAIDIVDKHENIRNEIKDYFEEILIDEYQDTSDLQDEFIERISKNNVYMVGDIKQSIYQFRNANPELFKEKYENFSINNGGIAKNLPDNFRSRNEVLEGINTIFDSLMDGKIGGANFKKSHHMKASMASYEEAGKWKTDHDNRMEILSYQYNQENKNIYPFDTFSTSEIEAFTVANDIKNKVNSGYLVGGYDEAKNALLRPSIWSDFCILLDRKTDFDIYKQVLTYFQIPTIIVCEETMDDSDLITAVKAIFKLLTCIYKEDYEYEFKFAYASLARSFLVELKDNELYEIFNNNNFKETHLYKRVLKLFEGIDSKTISGLIDEIIEEFDVYSKINKIGEIKANNVKIDYLYQLANKLNSIGYNYLDFNDYLTNIFNDDENKIKFDIEKGEENAVKIMTIHKSKGLEFPICYYPSLTKRFNDSDKKDRITFSKELGVIIPSFIEGKGLKDSIKKEIFKYDYSMSDVSERIRVFYVALTRAKEKLIMVCPIEDNSKNSNGIVDDNERLSFNSFGKMLNSIYNTISDYVKEIDIDDLNLSTNYSVSTNNIFKDLSKKGEKIVYRPSMKIEPKFIEQSSYSKKAGLIDINTIKKMELGTKIHYYLETLDFTNPCFEHIDDLYKDRILAFLNSDIMKNAKEGKAYKEYEFIYTENGIKKHGIIDLLMEYDDHFDIIDYKTKFIDDENYDLQLNGYRSYIESISNKKVNCYLYSIVDSIYREVIDTKL